MSLSFQLLRIAPELILAVGALALVLLGAIRGTKSTALIVDLTVLLIGIAALFIIFETKITAIVFDGAFIDDPFGRFMKVLALIGAITALILSMNFLKREGLVQFEFPILILLSTLGLLLMISAGSLMALYVGLELMSLALYVLTAYHREDARASEAGLKYFVLGALSSGMLLYGSSLIYGFSGTIDFLAIAQAVKSAPHVGVIFGLVFLLAGLAFKMSVVPFHMWTPDVYQGAPTPVTTFLASAPKVAAVAITVRVIYMAFPEITGQWQQIIIFMSLCSMALGSFAALPQTNIKRLMAYSSIGHMGFMLVGFAAGTDEGVQGVMLYMAIYVVMTLGTFAAILSMRVNGMPVERISDLAGLGNTHKSMAFFLGVMMFSLAGIPPLAGFFAKWYVFVAAIHAGLFWLSVLGVLCSVVAAYYYLRIVKVMYFDAPQIVLDKPEWTESAVLSLMGLLVLGYWFYPGPLVAIAANAARALSHLAGGI